jgi:hypothetical protein
MKLRSVGLPSLLLLLPAGLIAAALLAAAALPAAVSSDFGRQLAVRWLNAALPVEVSVDRIQLSWTGGAAVAGLQLAARDSAGQSAVSAQSVSWDGGLLSLLRGQPAQISIKGLTLDGMLDDSGEFRILQLLPSNKPARRRRPLPPSSSLKRAVRVGFTADAKLAGYNVTVSDSHIVMPGPYREIAGGDVHISGWLGSAHAADASWAADVPKDAAGADPFAFSVTAPNAQLSASGWRTAAGALRLRQPAPASVSYTPALAEYFLSALNPLLGDAVSLQQSGRIELAFEPDDLTYPAAETTVRMQPLRLTVGRSPLLRQLLATLAVVDKTVGKLDALDIWTAPIDAVISEAGPVRTRRTDVLLTGRGGQGGVHLVFWGSIDSQIDGKVDVTLGLPADTLQRLGLSAPDGHVLPIAIGGTADSYKVDWTTASAKLATLVARQRTGSSDTPADLTSAAGWAKSLMRRALSEADKATVITTPAPSLQGPLPWEG